jgi:hypothetical protein
MSTRGRQLAMPRRLRGTAVAGDPARPGELELGELLRAARLAVACGGASHPALRARLLSELSRPHRQPVSGAGACRLARALGAAARLTAVDHAAGLAPAVLPLPPAVLPGRLLAAQVALRPTRRPACGRIVPSGAGRGVPGRPARHADGAVPRGVGVAG